MDLLTGLGILGETISRNQSYTDIGHVREETRKANELAEKKNVLLKEQNELLKALAREKGNDLRKDEEKKADELGISVEEYKHNEFTKALKERQERKAKELGISVGEYQAQKNNKNGENNFGCTNIILIALGIFGLIWFLI